MCEHVLGAIHPATRQRTCIICRESVPAEGTFEVHRLPGSLERYALALFAQWDGHQIRRFLNVNRRAGDLLLHNWSDNYLYVYRAAPGTTVEVEPDEEE